MYLESIKNLMASRKFSESIQAIDAALIIDSDNGHIWNLRGDAIQLVNTNDGPPLDEAEKSYLKAFRLNSNDLETLEALAHFYDAVKCDPLKAANFANQYLKLVQTPLKEMARIAADNA